MRKRTTLGDSRKDEVIEDLNTQVFTLEGMIEDLRRQLASKQTQAPWFNPTGKTYDKMGNVVGKAYFKVDSDLMPYPDDV